MNSLTRWWLIAPLLWLLYGGLVAPALSPAWRPQVALLLLLISIYLQYGWRLWLSAWLWGLLQDALWTGLPGYTALIYLLLAWSLRPLLVKFNANTPLFFMFFLLLGAVLQLLLQLPVLLLGDLGSCWPLLVEWWPTRVLVTLLVAVFSLRLWSPRCRYCLTP